MGQDSEYSSKGASEIHLGGQADDGAGFVIIASHTHCIAYHPPPRSRMPSTVFTV